jgi:methionine-rich copper-binding protein CopC
MLPNRRTLVKALVSLIVPLLGVTVRPALVESHAVLVKSFPGARALLSRPPSRVQLWFSERLEPAFSTASVWSASGKQVDKRDASVSPDDPKELSVSLGTLGPGTYTVRCRILSVDGHVVEATFPFTIKPAS